jgi:hypothetical protein
MKYLNSKFIFLGKPVAVFKIRMARLFLRKCRILNNVCYTAKVLRMWNKKFLSITQQCIKYFDNWQCLTEFLTVLVTQQISTKPCNFTWRNATKQEKVLQLIIVQDSCWQIRQNIWTEPVNSLSLSSSLLVIKS